MTVLHESPEYYIQQCSNCGAILKYSLHDVNVGAQPFWVKGQICVAAYDSIVCPCCQTILPATKQWFYDAFLPQKSLTT